MATNAYFLNQYKLTTLSVAGGINDSQTTGIVVQDITGVEIAKPGICAITYADPIDTTKIEYVTYTSINNSTKALVGVTRGAEGSTAKAHDNGATVAFSIISESHINNLATALTIGGDETNMIEGVKDEDDMASDSATALSTQQSIKAYVDAKTRTRSIWLPASAFDIATGTPALADQDDTIQVWDFDAASVEGISASFLVPADYASGDITAYIYWYSAAVNTGDVVWIIRSGQYAGEGENISSAAFNDTATDTVENTVNKVALCPITLSGTAAAGKAKGIGIKRNASDGADTMTGDARFVGLRLDYTAY